MTRYLARRIKRARWEERLAPDPADVSADAVTVGLKTEGNRLSLWQCASHEAEIREVILACACAMKAPEPIDLVLLERDALESAGLSLECTPGNTPIMELRDRHVELTELTLAQLTIIAHRIAAKVRSDTDCYEFRLRQVQDIVVQAVWQRRIAIVSLRDGWQQELRRLRGTP